MDVSATNESSSSERRKRQRVTTERLDLSVYNQPHSYHNVSADESLHSVEDAPNGSSATAAELDSEESAPPTVTATTKPTRLFKAKSFLVVRNEAEGFFLCRALGAVYEDSRRCKVQWLEDVAPNKYEFSSVDYIQPMTIIAKVRVKREEDSTSSSSSSRLISIEEKDLARVKALLEKIKETGHVTADSSELEDSDDTNKATSSASDEADKSTLGLRYFVKV